MRLSKVLAISAITLLLGLTQNVQAEHVFKIGIMQDKPGAAQQYAPMLAFFKSKGINVKLQGYRSYTDAAQKFEEGRVDAMVAGSGVAGSMMIKDVAYPIVRPQSIDGTSTYWAVVLAPKGTPKFTGDPSYFDGKKIICSSLASSGEFFARSILGPNINLLKAASHGVAIKALAMNQADIAIVKNRVWDAEKGKYANLEEVGSDHGENPNNAMIVSFKTDKTIVDKIKAALLGLASDNSPEAEDLKKSLKITGYIPTTEQSFSHTLTLLKKAGVDNNFQFTY